MGDIMSRQDRWCDMTKEELQVELNMSEDLRCSDWRWGAFWNGVLTCVIIGFVFWTATHICQL